MLVAGGTGAVGRRLVGLLTPRHAVVAAGRTAVDGAASARLDATDPDSVERALTRVRPRLVVAALARGGPALAGACLARGVHYVDVTADAPALAAIEAHRAVATAAGATAVLSVGLAPGLTNLLARRACAGLERVHRLDIGLRLGAGDDHGPAGVAWVLEALGGGYAFARRRRMAFDGEARSVPAGSFGFPEQHTLPGTLGVPAVRTWLALRPGAVHALAAVAARTGIAARLPPGLAGLLARLPGGDDRWAVTVEARGERLVTLRRSGRDEAAMTARVAAEVVAAVLDGEAPGVWHIEQLAAADAILDRL